MVTLIEEWRREGPGRVRSAMVIMGITGDGEEEADDILGSVSRPPERVLDIVGEARLKVGQEPITPHSSREGS